ncbi:MAG: 50S ribosomal protein L11 methyltransferase, partial [Conexibacteraceae bacterium]|nr:50S ribosomal protein L11 methyltransferase [Conexibacteraceae bacterium]
LLLDLAEPGAIEPHADGPAAIDLGCGSGVLAIAAAKLGFARVLALDYDQLAVDATRENAAANGVELAGIERFDLREQQVPPAALVLANLLAPLLLFWAERMVERPGLVIASGLLAAEADRVAAAFAQRGYRETRRLELGEWAALLLEAPDRG